ncbi:hypothetical protein D9619_013092 [Psilocybe cf. subviscida]|uniref:P-loop containing nucleoside triphosphate hydrolase protein n=1 Tax=Psilocybe cf. subviscida TaxID=2480587 RepID=A0A8H5B166_9AGAR|nr:hypothetical protein D9619_013092 [Psilocybe cf. subviscida]
MMELTMKIKIAMNNTFLIPLAATAVSGTLFAAHLALSYYLEARERRGKDLNGTASRPASRNAVIRFFKTSRFFCVLALFVLSVAAFLQDPDRETSKLSVTLDPQVLVFASPAYTSILAVIAFAAPAWGRTADTHNNIVLLTVFAVYAYRNLWPLATFSEGPKDLEAQGPVLLWTRVVLLGLSSLVIPLFVPREHTPENPEDTVSPAQTASIASLLVYSYIGPLVSEANKVAHLSHDRVPPLPDYDHAERLSQKYFQYLDPVQGTQQRHIFFGLARIFAHYHMLRTQAWDYAFISATIVLQAFANFASPLAVNRILSSLERTGTGAGGDHVRLWAWVACLFLGQLVVSLCFQWYHYLATSALVRAQSILTQLVLEHGLRLRVKADTSNESSSSTKDEDVSKEEKVQDNIAGKINTLVTVDLDNIIGAKDCIMLFVQVPLELTLAGIFLYNVLGWRFERRLSDSALLGCATILILLPVPSYIAVHMQRILATKMQKTDARVQAVTEATGVMRMIKMFGWESRTSRIIKEKREEELRWLWKSKVLSLFTDVINFTIPILTMLVTFALYTLVMKENLTPSKVFSSMPVFTMTRYLLHHTSWLVSQLVKGRVALDRFDAFLRTTELIDEFDDTSAAPQPVARDTAEYEVGDLESDDVELEDIAFVWSKDDVAHGADGGSSSPFKLRIHERVRFKSNAINLIVGPTGCGKTSILMALLGEMKTIRSSPRSRVRLPRAGGVAYAAQESWILNETIRDNIIFGSPYDDERYRKVIHQCALERDLSLFKAGDRTEVGEKGLTLSGGQKARITLARAVYSTAKILLLDDILAALDVHTSKWIVDECLKGDLIRGRTVLLITHNIPLVAPIAEFIVTVGGDGLVREIGSDISSVLHNPAISLESETEALPEESSDRRKTVSEVRDIDDETTDGRLVLDEEMAQGRVGWNAILLFLRSLGGQHPILNFGTWIAGFVFLHGGNLLALWFLGYWGSQYETRPASDIPVTRYLVIYSIILFTSIIVYNIGAAVWYRMTIRSSSTVHSLLVESLLSATLRWLDKTPVSRIISRCTQDIGSLDSSLTLPFSAMIDLALCIIIRLLGPVILTPVLLIPGTIVIIAGVYLGTIYLKAQMSVKREMSNARSPVLAHLGVTTAGLVSIRAYSAQQGAKAESLRRIDHFAKLSRTSWNLNCWVSVRIDFLGTLFTTSLASYLLYTRKLSAANIGFSLNIALEFTIVILWLVRWYNEFEVQANSLERIQEYLEIDHEPKSTSNGKPPASWPSSGHLRVENLSAQYTPDGPKVLHDLSFEIEAGERVGISSLTLSLLRCIITQGNVYYDDILTDRLNLEDLRSNITIIPQMPELLSGTLRRNLDPFDQHDDSTLNNSLRASGLFSLNSEGENNRLSLDSNISAGGNNLSVGQRQIIALARAIIRQSKLLILDEATSAIDHETDSIIQASLRHELGSDVTVLTVAHRLQTIMDADRVMVLDDGRIVEFDSPRTLLAEKGSHFKALVDESGDKEALYAVANSHR